MGEIMKYNGKEWNGKVYGTEKYGFRVYLDGQETPISNEEAKKLQSQVSQKFSNDAYERELAQLNYTLSEATKNNEARIARTGKPALIWVSMIENTTAQIAELNKKYGR
jgi:uncharacterized membrane protein